MHFGPESTRETDKLGRPSCARRRLALEGSSRADERHDQAREWLESALNGTTRVGLPWWSLAAFVRIATNPRAYPDPLTADEAACQVEEWLDGPRAWLPQPTTNFRRVFSDLVRAHSVQGALVTDAQLAALAIGHGVPIASTDADFARFREVAWIDPLRS